MGRKKKSKGKSDNEAEAGEASSSSKYTVSVLETDIFKCEISPVYGRFLKAKTDVKKGKLILAERFLIAGPMRSSDLVCVGCHSDFKDTTDRQSCPRCFWPVCSKECADTIFHTDECKFFTEKRLKPPLAYGNSEFGALTVLRGLILKIQSPEKWDELIKLEAHNEIRKSLPLWRENTINVVNVILRDWELGEYFTEEEVHIVCGILEVNAFELGEKSSFRGIYPIAAMMATTQRRKMLGETKFFECTCKRCTDPRELGSNMGTIICQTCRGGDIFNLGSSDLTQNWVCTVCGSRVPVALIESQLEKWQVVINRAHDIPSSEKFLHNCKTLFHPTHFIPFDIKFNLCQAYGRESVPLEELSEVDLDRKLELCREVLKVLDIVTPGYTITRGLILYELQAAEVIFARRLQEMRKCASANLRRKLQLTLKSLKEAITILEFCHPASIEYEIAQASKQDTLIELNKWINSLK